ncbi:MAG: hypothetical protein ACI841_003406 [Planctomycetota bacterium]|jgi:hypothetical protein
MADQSETSPASRAGDDSDSSPGTQTDATQAEGRHEGEDSLERANDRLNFAKLDLSIETIDERISPSETNVFDK